MVTVLFSRLTRTCSSSPTPSTLRRPLFATRFPQSSWRRYVMRKALAAGLATGLLLVMAACVRNRQDPVPTPANSAPEATTTEHKLFVAGRQRHYRAHQPSTTPGLPL